MDCLYKEFCELRKRHPDRCIADDSREYQACFFYWEVKRRIDEDNKKSAIKRIGTQCYL